ncbi:ras-related protein Rab-40B isoform X2 [Tupaia chinensis]|uniref:ras-related protein Rab-40B isoform X2 n=1 Tax=Tupaia chinensis TaxID=246437 RepID=UPI000703FEA3|nr:ras-related protein Rab-40B isoform X2 [Tupaia chinensis]
MVTRDYSWPRSAGSTTGPPPSYWTAGGSSCSSGICQGREDSAPSSAPTRGSAQGVILVYDIANRWSFDGIAQWIKEIDEHAPGVPRILVGNRLHLAFKRQGPREQAQAYAERLGVTFFEVSPLCNFNVRESFTELARIVLLRHGVDRLWRPRKGRGQAQDASVEAFPRPPARHVPEG